MKRKSWRIKAACCAAAALFLLSGCDFVPADPSDLIQPPKLTSEQQAIETALEKSVKGKFTLQYPQEGDYRSSFILKNLDSDGEQEAIAFYRPDSENAGTHIQILDKVKGVWQKMTDISGEGNGNEVELIDFGDFNGDGKTDLAIGWTQFTSVNDLSLTVYSDTGKGYTKIYSNTFTKMKVLDMTGDGRQDILLLKQDATAKKTVVQLVSERGGMLTDVSTRPLDNTVSSYAGLYTTKVDGAGNGVLIDGYKGAHSMITELVYWKNGALHAPFYDAFRGVTTATLRDTPLTCRDMDGDGTYEIPFAVELAGYEKKDYAEKLWLVRWCAYKNSPSPRDMFSKKLSCVFNSVGHYYFIFPDGPWDSEVTIERRNSDADWIFRQWDPVKRQSGRMLFEIRTLASADGTLLIKGRSPYTLLSQNDNVTYLLMMGQKQGNNDPLYLSQDEIRKDFRIFE